MTANRAALQMNPERTNKMNPQNENKTDQPAITGSKLFAGSGQAVLIILVIFVGVSFIVNGSVPDGLIDFAKWVIGGTSAVTAAYMVKSGIENKAKIENQGDGPDNPPPSAEDGNPTGWHDSGGYDI